MLDASNWDIVDADLDDGLTREEIIELYSFYRRDRVAGVSLPEAELLEEDAAA